MDFPTTRWTMLAQASLHGDTAAGQALESFCLTYRTPIIRALRIRGVLEDRVEDLAHEFLLHLMQHSTLRRVKPERGRFRSFVAGALSRFLCDDARANQAQKRGGSVAHVTLEDGREDAESCGSGEGNDVVLDREWALHLMDSAVGDLEQEWMAAGKAQRFTALRPFLPGASVAADHEVAMRLTGMSDGTLRAEVSRLRKRFRDAVRMRVAASVVSPADVDSELAHLYRVLITS
jgi:hypothetical protein